MNTDTAGDPRVLTRIQPRPGKLGEHFDVQRALPSAACRRVGPFVFLDRMGPTRFPAGAGLDVPAHPHIGLATVTWLFSGELLHRDSLGTVQPIRPGEVNWMTAGRGIAHSERSPASVRRGEHELYGLQAWVALPRDLEATAPSFAHHGREELPRIEQDGARLTLIAGDWAGERSPVTTHSPLFYAELSLQAGARFTFPAEHEERALYLLAGRLPADADTAYEAGELLVLAPGTPVELHAETGPVHAMLLGGAPLDGHRHIWWNFVASERASIEQAKADWAAGRFAAVPDEHDPLPLPGPKPAPVKYP
ncbi:pirin family protein [Alkalilimnicola sp. S0819]|uniref:pirin family protein n=1 Tax=Alkalilimnicola sp. S0819 TaxID=2613922 RepID=UPI0012619DED|nr:pirin family protein [Alkalilimnicola sp. S0819]KAB7627372.1 pirin family protein [Alkalilimnicola sp. S0819]MPQ16090.1 hypothetical protein [Alkalilimnicola sp. S0819]